MPRTDLQVPEQLQETGDRAPALLSLRLFQKGKEGQLPPIKADEGAESENSHHLDSDLSLSRQKAHDSPIGEDS